jgi:protein involved in temperature-dependent protein secretion
MDKEPSEIAKLTERISKDPKSKLFVPLAEEYKKAGNLEMSIHVLKEGLKNNPEYVTARSILGRILVEKGDLAGAQKEFEEVTKAIPDNLVAQRKLGDLYVLQNRPADALEHYRIVLSLNPRDEEMAALVSDVEAGRDVKERLLRPKQPAGEKHPPSDKTSTSAGVTAPLEARPNPFVVKEPEHLGAPAMSSAELEEPEEVLVVEPLDVELQEHQVFTTELAGQKKEEILPEPEGQVEKKRPAGDFDFLTEQGRETGPAQVQEEPAEITFDTAEQGKDTSSSPAGIEEVTLVEMEPAEKVPSASTEKEDDLTTDTLAELYITQGFFEKAIDIYQRMLADKPDSQELKDKLTHVRAMADQAEHREVFATEVKPASAGGVEAVILREPEQPAETESGPEVEAAFDVTPAAPVDAGVEPVEYVPTEAAEKEQPLEKKASPMMKSKMANRQETIDRLEIWLKNIRKEK